MQGLGWQGKNGRKSGLQGGLTILRLAPMSALRIQRYIIRETLGPSLLALVIFTFVVLMGRLLQLVDLVLNKGASLLAVGHLVATLLPSFFVLTLPLSFLIGVLSAMSRMSADNEIVALKASGVSLYGIIKPILLLSLVFCSLCAALTLDWKPSADSSFRDQIFQMASRRASIGLQERVFNTDFSGLTIYTNQLDDRSGVMHGVFIADERAGGNPALITARQGRIISDPDRLTLTLRLEDGSIHRQPGGKNADNYQLVHFSTYDISLSLQQEQTAERRRKTRELSTAQLLRSSEDAPDRSAARRFLVELNKRLTLPFAPLVFALIATPLGLTNTRSGRGGGFAMGLMVFLAYYVIQSLSETMVSDAGQPIYLLWLPILVFLVSGSALLILAAREKNVLAGLFALRPLRRLGNLLFGDRTDDPH